jgi:hypothetical protein
LQLERPCTFDCFLESWRCFTVKFEFSTTTTKQAQIQKKHYEDTLSKNISTKMPRNILDTLELKNIAVLLVACQEG